MKAISLLLLDDTASGRIKASYQGWNCITYRIPREMLDRCKDKPEFNRGGIYLLFGGANVYVGQASVRQNGKGIYQRVVEHTTDALSNAWEEAIVLTGTSDTILGLSEVSYLENAYHNKAASGGRFTVLNRNTPSGGIVSEEKECVLLDHIERFDVILEVFGRGLTRSQQVISLPTTTEDVSIVQQTENNYETEPVCTDRAIDEAHEETDTEEVPEPLNLRDMIVRYGCSRNFILQYYCNQGLPYRKTRNQYVFTLEEIEAWEREKKYINIKGNYVKLPAYEVPIGEGIPICQDEEYLQIIKTVCNWLMVQKNFIPASDMCMKEKDGEITDIYITKHSVEALLSENHWEFRKITKAFAMKGFSETDPQNHRTIIKRFPGSKTNRCLHIYYSRIPSDLRGE